MLDAVCVELGVGDLEIEHRINLHGDVILGDNRLGRVVHDLLLEADPFGDPFDKRHLKVDTHLPDGGEGAKTLDDIGAGLLHDKDVAREQNQNGDYQYGDCNNGSIFRHDKIPPSNFMTRWRPVRLSQPPAPAARPVGQAVFRRPPAGTPVRPRLLRRRSAKF